MLQQEAGTIVSSDTEGIEYAGPVGSASGTS
jgi:hypothetical protein